MRFLMAVALVAAVAGPVLAQDEGLGEARRLAVAGQRAEALMMARF